MRSLLRRFRRTPSPKPLRDGSSAASGEESAQCTSHSRFTRSSRVVQTVSAIKPVYEPPETPTRSRRRDRLKTYLSRRRQTKPKGTSYLWPAMLSAEKDEIRSSDDTEADDVYMVDFHSDSDSDDDSLFEDSHVTPPVAIPESYRRQDRLGGIIVAGARVLFTYAGFKRRQIMLSKLQSVPECEQLEGALGLHREQIIIGAFC
ncbi:hypothetical protein PHMEG_00027121 [Phytophthora megakarya]|uniref:Uncharacterized protein n=1 Tax=Phytophthora megakarya TaxID=4795 RepID=A0A225V9B7_9STRA|nr:hypothetical protein PHMEG_00027121 [Phytophthora megakarya]